MSLTSEFDADPIRWQHIEFVGGPYDGHVESYHTRARLLPREVTWRVDADVIRTLHDIGQESDSDPHQSITSVAIYARETANETYRYRFVGAISIKQLADSIRDHKES